MKTKAILAAFLLLALLLSACGGTSQGTASPAPATAAPPPSASSVPETASVPPETGAYPLTIVDTAGRTITIEKPLERIYYGFYYENLLAVAGADVFKKVAATSLRDTEDYYATASKLYREHLDGYAEMIDVGSTMHDDFDMEALLEMELDAAIIGSYQYTDLGDRVSVLEDAGVPVIVIDYSKGSMEMQCQSTKILGDLFGQRERAEKLVNEYQSAYADIAERLSAVTEKKPAFLEFHSMISTYQEIGSTGSGSFSARYMENAGSDNIMKSVWESSDQQRIDPEYLLERDPYAIFIVGGESLVEGKEGALMGHGVTEEQVVASLQNMVPSRPGWDTLSAVTENRVLLFENGKCRQMSDYSIVQFMAKNLYPELFEDVDPLQNLKDYYAEYLPEIPFDGIFFYQYKYEG